MKVIIVGAGDVGYVAAETICPIHDVLIIEKDADVAESIKGRLNASVLHEDGTNPRTLRYAMQNHHADMIISTLHQDEANLFICMMAKRIDSKIKTISTINNPDYLIEKTSDGFEGIDIFITPEIITANKMYCLATMENLVDYEPMGDIGLSLGIFAVESYNPVVGQIVMNIDTHDEFTIFGIYRDGFLDLSVDTMEIHTGDRICAIGTIEGLTMLNECIGVEEKSREFVILGGSIVGGNLAKMLSQDPTTKRYVKIIDKNPDQCRELSKMLNGVVVLNADFTEPDVQVAENVFKADCLISTSRLDDTNLLMCMSAQKYNARKVVSRYFKKEYEDIFKFTGLECIIGYDKVVSNEVTRCTISDDMVILRMRTHNEMFFSHSIDTESKLHNKYLGDLSIPEGIRIVAVIRGEEIIYPRMDTKMLEGDRVIVFTNLIKDSDLARVFGKSVVAEL